MTDRHADVERVLRSGPQSLFGLSEAEHRVVVAHVLECTSCAREAEVCTTLIEHWAGELATGAGGGLKTRAEQPNPILRRYAAALVAIAVLVGAAMLAVVYMSRHHRPSNGREVIVVGHSQGGLANVEHGDHAHGGVYLHQSEMDSAGAINAGTNPVNWTSLKGAPPSVLNSTPLTFGLGDGLTLVGTTCSVAFGGTGSAATAARSDHAHDSVYAAIGHKHDAAYLKLAGGTLTGAVTSSLASGTPLAATTDSRNLSDSAISGTNNGSGNGISGTATSSGSAGVYGLATSPTGSSYGVYGQVQSGAGVGVYATASTAGGNALVANLDANGTSNTTSGNIAIFQSGSSNVARIDKSGKGYFNGGTQTGGADFAESIHAESADRALEPGDVLVISKGSDGAVALCTDSESTAVAGVYSTKPGVLATLHNGAADSLPPDEVPVGMVGRIPTKCCDEGGPIHRGDLLVSASRPGYAKRAPAAPKPGTIIGKAFADLEKGADKILVLVTLQ